MNNVNDGIITAGSNRNAATASAIMLRLSPRKLNLLASFVRGMNVWDALLQLDFSHKRAAVHVKKCIQSALANAENTIRDVDIDNLQVLRATVGKARVLQRAVPRARGRSARVKKYFSSLYITVGELDKISSSKGK
ncbi:50S ribosomal protein L22 [Rickettsiales endosymbiont of Paramecium tredecaurelia]|uniref:50S ribosomal protein L22 n=1 Tax=Candidatus Sarmatiella mevalonica TaxID=2770581 RepID=UPI0019216312|nr:50S ribosomal protein L22 [Candidatus Sarmatiella mevalonica]MBL3284574.1 50S ribosomal protein L22 [Candidatus Sarmatiella mevalonica]